MKHTLSIVAGVALVLQTASAVLQVRGLETPNASTAIARHLVDRGEFALIGGSSGMAPPTIRRAVQLPGEPLYLAAGFLVLPASFHRYLHVPVSIALVTAIAAVGCVLGGRRMALATGLIASFEPFVLRHGPVWDDTFMAAALEWTVFAVVIHRLRRPPGPIPAAAGRWKVFGVAICAGWAAVTRFEAQLVLGAVGLVLVASRALRPARSLGWSLLGGMTLTMSAWGIRNLLVLGVFFLGSTHDGQTLYQSTHGRARESIVRTGVAQSLLHLTAPPGVDELEEDRLYARAAWSYIGAHPFEFIKTAVFKMVVSLTGVNFTAPVTSARNIVAIGTNVGLILLASLGLRRRRAGATPEASDRFFMRLVAIVIGVTIVMLALGPVGLRYRICLAGILYPGAGLLAARLRTA